MPNGLVIGCDWFGLATLAGEKIDVDDSGDGASDVEEISQAAFKKSAKTRATEAVHESYRIYALLFHVGKLF